MINSSFVKSLAASLGFDACGIVPIPERKAGEIPFREDLHELQQWVGEGRHGGMKYLEDFEKRAARFWQDFPEARTIIVVAANYYSDSRHCESGEARRSNLQARGLLRRADRSVSADQAADRRLTDRRRVAEGGASRNDKRSYGRVAHYAWGRDYHKVLKKRLQIFCEKLSETAGREVRAEICVDTQPLLERSLAQRAGLGFIGKQTQLLNPKLGPWLLLGELVTDLELEPDRPLEGNCGNCTICIDECPTQALLPEGGIDARRCISYLTIEHKGPIPEEFHSQIGDWVFGCDICLQVCPYAAKGKETGWAELKPESGAGEFLDLVEILKTSSNRLHEKRFRESAIQRARKNQLQRNARIVLANQPQKVPGT